MTYAAESIVKPGDHIVSASMLYGGARNLFAHTLSWYGISSHCADPCDSVAFVSLIDARTKAIWAESVGNPLAIS